MAIPSYIQKNDSITRDWRTVNTLIDEAKAIHAKLNQHNGAIADLRNRIPFIQKGGTSGEVKVVTITTVNEDTYTCDDDGSELIVAKPWRLRGSVENETLSVETVDESDIYSSDDVYVEYYYYSTTCRKASAGDESEIQIVVPIHISNESIAVMRAETGIADVDWIDLNLAGRVWTAI